SARPALDSARSAGDTELWWPISTASRPVRPWLTAGEMLGSDDIQHTPEQSVEHRAPAGLDPLRGGAEPQHPQTAPLGQLDRLAEHQVQVAGQPVRALRPGQADLVDREFVPPDPAGHVAGQRLGLGGEDQELHPWAVLPALAPQLGELRMVEHPDPDVVFGDQLAGGPGHLGPVDDAAAD